MKLPKLGYGKQTFLAFLKTSNKAASPKYPMHDPSDHATSTQTVLDFHTCGELSNRSKRKCLHEDETGVQRISLKHQHGCSVSVEWQQRSYPIRDVRAFYKPSFLLSFFFVITSIVITTLHYLNTYLLIVS